MQRWKRGNATAGVSIVWTRQCFAVGAAWTAWILLQLLECRRVAREVPKNQFPSACSQAPQVSHWPVWVSRRMGSTLVTPQLPVPIGRRHADPTSLPFAGARVLRGLMMTFCTKSHLKFCIFRDPTESGTWEFHSCNFSTLHHARISSAERAPLASTRRRPRMKP